MKPPAFAPIPTVTRPALQDGFDCDSLPPLQAPRAVRAD